jgi:hypothetical protein
MSRRDTGRQTPSDTLANLAAERAAVACYLMYGGDAPPPVTTFAPEDLTSGPLATILRSIHRVVAAGLHVDEASVIEELRASGRLTDAAGAATIIALGEEARDRGYPSPAYYVGVVQACARSRRLRNYFEHWQQRVELGEDPEVLAAEVRATLDAAPAAPGTAGFQLVPVDALGAMPDPVWQVAGLFQAGRFGVFFGAPGSGKSLFVLDCALSIASGLPLLGERAVLQGTTAYVLAEGSEDIKARVEAWKTHHGVTEVPGAFVLLEPVNLMDATEVHQLVAALRRLPPPVTFVAIDTLARSMPGGKENATEDMNTVVAACALLKRELGCTLGLVHHCPHDEFRARGSTALKGATDFEIGFLRDANDRDRVTVSNPKLRFAREWAPFCLRFESLDDQHMVLVADGTAPEASDAPLNDTLIHVLSVLVDLGGPGLRFTAWWKLVPTLKAKKSTFAHKVKGLVARRYVEQHGAIYTPTAAGRAALAALRWPTDHATHHNVGAPERERPEVTPRSAENPEQERPGHVGSASGQFGRTDHREPRSGQVRGALAPDRPDHAQPDQSTDGGGQAAAAAARRGRIRTEALCDRCGASIGGPDADWTGPVLCPACAVLHHAEFVTTSPGAAEPSPPSDEPGRLAEACYACDVRNVVAHSSDGHGWCLSCWKERCGR